MYFGLYQLPRRHYQLDALPYEAPRAGLLQRLHALLRRLFH